MLTIFLYLSPKLIGGTSHSHFSIFCVQGPAAAPLHVDEVRPPQVAAFSQVVHLNVDPLRSVYEVI